MDTEETTPIEAMPEEVVAPETEMPVVEEEETAPVAEEEAPAV